MIDNNPRSYNNDRLCGSRDLREGSRGVNVGNYEIHQNGDAGINLGCGSVIQPNGNVDIKVGAIMFNADGSMSTNFGLG